MAKLTAKNSGINISDTVAIMDQLKQASNFLPRYVALLSDWTAVNDLYKTRLQKMLDELKKHVEQLNVIIGNSLSSLQSENVGLDRKSDITPALALAPKKVDEQLAAKSAKVPGKVLTLIANAPGKTPAMAAGKRPLPPSNEPQTKRPKSSDNKMAAISDKNELDKIANENKNATKKYPKPFMVLSPIAIKKEKVEESVVNSKGTAKITVPVAAVTVRKAEAMVKVADLKTRNSDVSSMVQKAKQKDSIDAPKLDWNPVVSSTPNVGSDVSTSGPKKASIKPKNKVARKSDEKVERRTSLRSAGNVIQRKNSMN